MSSKRSQIVSFEEEVAIGGELVTICVKAEVELGTPPSPEDPGEAVTVQFLSARRDTGEPVQVQGWSHGTRDQVEYRALEMAEVLVRFKDLDLDEPALDEEVHAAKGSEASDINNAGIEAQLHYLLEAYGREDTMDILEKLKPSDGAEEG